MSEKFLNEINDMAWLTDVHLKGVTKQVYGSCILTGNEDYPTKLELWENPNPRYDDPPDLVLDQEAIHKQKENA